MHSMRGSLSPAVEKFLSPACHRAQMREWIARRVSFCSVVVFMLLIYIAATGCQILFSSRLPVAV